jgi:hypothetical protein
MRSRYTGLLWSARKWPVVTLHSTVPGTSVITRHSSAECWWVLTGLQRRHPHSWPPGRAMSQVYAGQQDCRGRRPWGWTRRRKVLPSAVSSEPETAMLKPLKEAVSLEPARGLNHIAMELAQHMGKKLRAARILCATKRWGIPSPRQPIRKVIKVVDWKERQTRERDRRREYELLKQKPEVTKWCFSLTLLLLELQKGFVIKIPAGK